MSKWTEMVKKIEKACIEETMVGLTLHGSVIGYMEYYFYINEIELDGDKMNIRSGNFEFTLHNNEEIQETSEGYQIVDNGNELDLMLVA